MLDETSVTSLGELAAAIDEVVGRLLDRARTTEPPVDAVSLAGRLGMLVAFDCDQPVRGRTKRLRGRHTILLQPDDRPERVQWAAAHELGEIHAADVLDGAELDVEGLDPSDRERLANLFANRLLLPSAWFFADVRELDADLLALKRRYATASHELIAVRMLDGDRPLVATVFDNGRLVRRRGNVGGRVPRPTPTERACWQRVRNREEPCETRGDGVLVRGWPLYEEHWRREILLTFPAGEDEAEWD